MTIQSITDCKRLSEKAVRNEIHLNKKQITGLLLDKPVVDGHGRKFKVGDNVKEILQMLVDDNLLDKYQVVVENGEIDVVEKLSAEVGVKNE